MTAGLWILLIVVLAATLTANRIAEYEIRVKGRKGKNGRTK